MLKMMLRKFVGTVKIVRVVRGFTLLGLNWKKKGFSMFNKDIKYWDVRDCEQFKIRPIWDPTFQM